MTSSDKNNTPRHPVKLLAFAAALAASLASNPIPAQTNDRAPRAQIEMMLKSGAYDFGLQRIDNLQGGAGDDPQTWLDLENLRYDLYSKREEWGLLVERLGNLPADLPEIQRQSLMTHGAELLLDSGRGETARDVLRGLIWHGGVDSKQLNYWRRLVVRSYLADDMTGDAQIAMSLYEREYLPADTNWDYLFAQVLLRQGNAELAAQRLGNVQQPAGRVLRLLARLRAGIDTPQTVLTRTAALREELADGSPLAAANWAVTAEAAWVASEPEARVQALEQLFNGPPLPSAFSFVRLTVGELWDAYDDLGTRLGNAENLLFGNPDPWTSLADSMKGEGAALKARAINAAVARRGRSTPELEALHLALYQRLEAAGLDTLKLRLYEDKGEFPTVDEVPDTVRHEIVADAIEQRDIKRAARFAAHLSAPNTEQPRVQWDLTRARLALYSGDLDDSESIMRSLVLSRSEFEPETADRVMQPIFDLQSVGRSAGAFELLDHMYDRVTTPKQKREILLWLGDAKKDLGEYETAAEYYLRSAFEATDPTDLWGQSARYHAAEALEEAGLFDDAERIYETLIEEVGEGKRAAALHRRLQELWVNRQESGATR